MSQSWIQNINTLGNLYNNGSIVETYLDETYTKIDNVPGLKTSLFPHQKTIVRAMLDLEANRTFNISDRSYSYECKTTAGILSEAVGSGKTVDILSVILLHKIPKPFPDISELNMYERESYRVGWGVKKVLICPLRSGFLSR